MFHWDYWQVEALPVDYIEELLTRVAAENDLAAAHKAEGDMIARMRAANQAVLQKMGLGRQA